MYGKFFSSCFTGSMLGAGPTVFAVWAYVIAYAQDSTIELNPNLLATVIGADKATIESAIAYLCSPDPASRNPAEEGKRLVHDAAFQYHVVSHERYRAIKNREDLREYERERKREQRRKKTEMTQSAPTCLDCLDVSGTCPGQDGTPVSVSDSDSVSGEINKDEPDNSMAAQVVATWNRITEGKLPQAKLTPRRRQLINARLKESGWLAEFAQACAFIAESEFYRGWYATLDHLLQEGKVTELAERATQEVVASARDGALTGYAGCPPGMKFFTIGEPDV